MEPRIREGQTGIKVGPGELDRPGPGPALVQEADVGEGPQQVEDHHQAGQGEVMGVKGHEGGVKGRI